MRPSRLLTAVAALFLLPGLAGCSSEPDLAIQIVSPADGDTVPAGEPIPVEAQVAGGHIQGTGGQGRPGHLHLYVDRQLVSMTDETAPTVTLEPGRHLVMVEFADENHASLGVTDQVEVTAE